MLAPLAIGTSRVGALPVAGRPGLARYTKVSSGQLLGKQHGRRRSLSTAPRGAAAKAAGVEVAAEVLYEATGVPLVDELLKFATVEAAVQHSIQLVATAAVGVVVGTLLLNVLDKKGLGGEGGDFNLVGAVLASVIKPGQVLLPYYGAVYTIKVVSALAQVAAAKLEPSFATMCYGKSAEVIAALKWFTQLVQDTSELVVTIMAAWAAINFKNRLLEMVSDRFLSDGASNNDGAVHLLRPISGVLDCIILTAAAATALTGYGINIGPLMASLGGIGVVLGLASQRLMENAAAALTLFTSRPFIVGDYVQLLDGKNFIVEGVVVQLEPMRTAIQDDKGIVYINNSEVSNYIIRNVSQLEALKEATAVVAPVAAPKAA